MAKRAARKLGFATQCVRAGDPDDDRWGAVAPPIYQTSTFASDTTLEQWEIIEGRRLGHCYTRYSNPTTRGLETKMATLEGGEDAVAFASGMAAVSACVLACVKRGDRAVVQRDVYGGTFEVFHRLLPRFGVRVTTVNATDLVQVRAAARRGTRLIYVETPANPLLSVVDLAGVAEIGRKAGATTICDSTFATPVNSRPLEFGIDVVLHSATKYLGGHADLMAGVAVGTTAFCDRLEDMVRILGGVLDPFAAWLVTRGIKSLGPRVAVHNANATACAEFLAGHPRVRAVHYPGLPAHPQHALAKRQMSGFGGVLSFEIAGTADETSAVVDRFRLFRVAPSLGAVESLALQPAATTHSKLSPRERKAVGIRDSLVRLACGIESAEDLVDDLRQALGGRRKRRAAPSRVAP